MQGRDYHVPMSSFDTDRIGSEHLGDTEIKGRKLIDDKDENPLPAAGGEDQETQIR